MYPGQDAGLQPVALVQLGHHRDERRRDAARFPRSSGSWASSSTSSPTAATRSTASPRRSSPPRCATTACSPWPGCSGSSDCSSRRTGRRRRSSAGPGRRGADGRLGPDGDHEGDGRGLDAAPAPGPDRGADPAAGRAGSSAGRPTRGRRADPRSTSVPTPPARRCSSWASPGPMARRLANVVFATIAGSTRPNDPLDPRPEHARSGAPPASG